MRCVHGRDVGFGSECWECEQDKRHHQESVNLQQQALDGQREALEHQRRHYEETRAAQERQEELLREAAYAQEQTAQAQRAQLALQEQEIKEGRAKQRLEEERRELRTGLPEFSDAYRSAWLSVSNDHDALESKTSTLNKELALASQNEKGVHAEVTKIWDEIHRDLAQNLQSTLERGTPVLDDPPPELGSEASRKEIHDLAERVKAVGVNLRAPAASVHSSDGPVLRLYRELAAVAGRLDSFTKAPPKTPAGAIGCFLFLLACLAVGIAGALQQPGKYGMAVLFYILVAAIPALIATRRFALIRAISSGLPQAHSATTRIVTLLTTVPEVEAAQPPPLSSLAQGSREDCLKALASVVAAGLRATVLALLEMYKAANFKSHPKAPVLAELSAQWKVATDRVADIRLRLEKSPEEISTEQCFETMRQEVRRVGRLILEGRRVSGSKIDVVQCPNCANLLSSESLNCPRCGHLA